jgi:hypothetical protein
MAAKKKPRRAGPADDVRKTLVLANTRAREVLAFRAKQQRKRARAIAATVSTALVERPRPIPPRTAALLGSPATAGVLIAEGDSWFDYPLHDVLKMLEDEHAFDAESVAHRGDRVEEMAFGPGQLEEFSRRLEKVLRTGVVPKAILLSGGGNDIAGDEFGMLLNHAASPIAGLNDDIVTGVIDRRIKTAYVFVIGVITAICQRYVNQPIPIIVHGYDFPVPDGRGFLGGFWLLPGPWLKPGFDEKGFTDLSKNTAIMRDLIGRFNVMLKAATAPFSHVHYLDLRSTLPNDSRYKTFWANELHPKELGFRLVANKFASLIAKV